MQNDRKLMIRLKIKSYFGDIEVKKIKIPVLNSCVHEKVRYLKMTLRELIEFLFYLRIRLQRHISFAYPASELYYL